MLKRGGQAERHHHQHGMNGRPQPARPIPQPGKGPTPAPAPRRSLHQSAPQQGEPQSAKPQHPVVEFFTRQAPKRAGAPAQRQHAANSRAAVSNQAFRPLESLPPASSNGPHRAIAAQSLSAKPASVSPFDLQQLEQQKQEHLARSRQPHAFNAAHSTRLMSQQGVAQRPSSPAAAAFPQPPVQQESELRSDSESQQSARSEPVSFEPEPQSAVAAAEDEAARIEDLKAEIMREVMPDVLVVDGVEEAHRICGLLMKEQRVFACDTEVSYPSPSSFDGVCSSPTASFDMQDDALLFEVIGNRLLTCGMHAVFHTMPRE